MKRITLTWLVGCISVFRIAYGLIVPSRTEPCATITPPQTPQDSILYDVTAYGYQASRTGYTGRRSIEGVLWIVPKTYHVTYQLLEREIGEWFGCSYSYWKYESPSMDYVCYTNGITSLPMPLTSKGIELHIQNVDSLDVYAEDIYEVTGEKATKYPKDKLSKLGWRKDGPSSFTFTVPPNTTGKERYWRVNMYFTELIAPTPQVRVKGEPEIPQEKRRVQAGELNFIQVVDTTFIPRLFKRGGFGNYEVPICREQGLR